MTEFHVDGMTCAHCAVAVRDAVLAVPGVTAVAVDGETGVVQVDGTSDAAAVRDAITAEGYAVS